MKSRILTIISIGLLTVSATGCYTSGSNIADQLNPFADPTGTELGDRNTNALGGGTGGGKQAESARNALEVMGSYRRAEAPQPYYPVVRPAEIRLMWIPDHLNKLGDLVPAHYYYLKVLREEFEVQDAFDNERILNATGPLGYRGGAAAAAPAAVPGAIPGVAAPAPIPSGGDAGLEGGTATPWQYKDTKR